MASCFTLPYPSLSEQHSALSNEDILLLCARARALAGATVLHVLERPLSKRRPEADRRDSPEACRLWRPRLPMNERSVPAAQRSAANGGYVG